VPDIILETERLILRTAQEGDVDLFDKHLNTPNMRRHLGGPHERHEIEQYEAKSEANFAQHGFGWMAMMEKATGEFVGQCGLKRVDAKGASFTGDFEIGWMVREDRWRRGYAREAVLATLDWAFTRHAASHVVALTSEANEASWRFMEAIGLKRRADLDFYDPDYPPEENPTKVYVTTREQWERTR